MKNRDVEEKVYYAFSNSVPDVLDNILSKCEDKKGFESDMKKKYNEKKGGIFISNNALVGVFSALVVVGISVIGFNAYDNNYKVDSVVGFDVNPSVELLVNRKEEVIKANALNDDAKKVIKGMDLKNTDVDVAVNALIGSMLKNGYLSLDANSILVSVQNDDVKRGEKLQKEITDEIEKLLKKENISSSVLAQEIITEDVYDITRISEDYGVSVGKVKLINEVIDSKLTDTKGKVYDFDSLVGLSINELKILLEDKKAVISNVNSIGTASKNSLIGNDKAKSIAITDAKVKESKVKELEIELDADDGRLVYEVEFKVSGKEYEYDINALTGKIVYRHTEKDDDYVSSESSHTSVGSTEDVTKKKTTTKKATSYIGKDKAKAIAFNNAGVKESEVKGLEVELDKDDGVVSYEIEFNVGRTEYSYDINAITGKIIEKDIDRDDD